MNTSQTSIIIADSSTISRLGLNAIINQMDGFIVVGEADNSKSVLDLIIVKSPDLVIIDFLSDDFDIETVMNIKRKFPKLFLLGITPLQNGNTLINALRAGIDSYIKKSCDIPEVVDAIESTSKGKSFYCGKILEKIRKESIDISEMNNIDLSCDAVALSRREKEILTLISEGLTNSKIAEILFLSSHTITTHRKNIMSKLGVKNTAGIVMYAVKSGIVSPNKFLFAS
ncbi:MAG: response regulator transcription factor [Flavobacteriales bacterium]|jgi:DNA-binding NarL/FixJ family response regulator|tara:strand:+ start:1717 stop:2400 length:684 start_codon:yes stop_codon:yes gene_type:complete